MQSPEQQSTAHTQQGTHSPGFAHRGATGQKNKGHTSTASPGNPPCPVLGRARGEDAPTKGHRGSQVPSDSTEPPVSPPGVAPVTMGLQQLLSSTPAPCRLELAPQAVTQVRSVPMARAGTWEIQYRGSEGGRSRNGVTGQGGCSGESETALGDTRAPEVPCSMGSTRAQAVPYFLAVGSKSSGLRAAAVTAVTEPHESELPCNPWAEHQHPPGTESSPSSASAPGTGTSASASPRGLQGSGRARACAGQWRSKLRKDSISRAAQETAGVPRTCSASPGESRQRAAA